jgi:hypothetical protein
MLTQYDVIFNENITLFMDFIIKIIEIDSVYRKQLTADFLNLFLASLDLINKNDDPKFVQFLYDCFSRIIETEAYHESDTKFIRTLLNDLIVRVFEDNLKSLNFYLIITKVLTNFNKINVC